MSFSLENPKPVKISMQLPLHIDEKTQYCEYWQHNAAAFEEQECYSWMSEQLLPYSPARILDIGCGTGEGIAALLSRGAKSVVCLEENFDCIKATESKLSALGHNVTVIPRLGYDVGPDGRHSLVVEQDEEIEEGDEITLIHADPFLIGGDRPLTRYLEGANSFDAVTIWLIGTYMMRQTCRTLDGLPIEDPKGYRLLLQNRIYELADRVLRIGGVLHIVDRGAIPDVATMTDMAYKLHREQAETTSLKVTEFAYIPYVEPSGKRIGMTDLVTDNPEIVDNGTRSMQSIISIKPQ